jgi:hypothetical protein
MRRQKNLFGMVSQYQQKFAFIQEQLDMLNRIEGNKFCEYKMGLTKNLEPCDFFSQDVWCEGDCRLDRG